MKLNFFKRDKPKTGKYHKNLNEYFNNKPLYLDEEKQKVNVRKLAEQPFHQVCDEQWDEGIKTLTDLRFLDAKVRAGLVYALLKDFEFILSHLPESRHLKELEAINEIEIENYINSLIETCKKGAKTKSVLQARKVRDYNDIYDETERLRAAPTRLERLLNRYDFIRSESNKLIRYGKCPYFLVQQALNTAYAGQLKIEAERISREEKSLFAIRKTDKNLPKFNPFPELIKTIEGHPSWINSVSISPNGKIAVTGCNDHIIRMIDLSTGDFIKTFAGHTDDIKTVKLSFDNQFIISGSSDETIRIWNVLTGACEKILTDEDMGLITSIDITADYQYIISGGKTVRIWSFMTGDCVKRFDNHANHYVDSVKITPDGKIAVSGDNSGTIMVWDVKNGTCIKSLTGHNGDVSCIDVSADGKFVLSGSDDTYTGYNMDSEYDEDEDEDEDEDGEDNDTEGSREIDWDNYIPKKGSYVDRSVRFWDVESGKCLHVMRGHRDGISSVALTHDGQYAVSCGGDRVLRVWDTKSGQCIKIFKGHTYSARCVSITPDGRFAISGGIDNVLILWNLETGLSFENITYHTDEYLWHVVVSKDGKYAITGGYDKLLRQWDIKTMEVVNTMHNKTGQLPDFFLTWDNRFIVTSDSGIWDFESKNTELHRFYKHTDYITCVSHSIDGRLLITGSYDNNICLYDMNGLKCIRTFEGHQKSVESVAFLPDGKSFISASADNTIRIWSINDSNCVKILSGHRDKITSICVSPSGRYAISGGKDNVVKIWDLFSCTCINDITGFESEINVVKMSPDEKFIYITCGVPKGVKDFSFRIYSFVDTSVYAVYPSDITLLDTDQIQNSNSFIMSTGIGTLDQINVHGYKPEFPVVTASRFWNYGRHFRTGKWNEQICFICPSCGKLSIVDTVIIDAINSLHKEYSFDQVSSSYLSLDKHAWGTTSLISSCPSCNIKVVFNPIVLDGEGFIHDDPDPLNCAVFNGEEIWRSDLMEDGKTIEFRRYDFWLLLFFFFSCETSWKKLIEKVQKTPNCDSKKEKVKELKKKTEEFGHFFSILISNYSQDDIDDARDWFYN